MAQRPSNTPPARRPPSLPRIDPAPGMNTGYGMDIVSRGRDEADAITEAGGDPDAEKPTPEEERDAAEKKRRHSRAIRNFKVASSADDLQRRAELDDLKYARARLEDHWPDADRKARQGDQSSDSPGKARPARPCLVLDKIAVPKRQTMNEARNARLSIRVKAKAGRATKQQAMLVQSAVRAIEVDSRASIARNWALERAIICGRGYYRVLTEYANDKDRDLDIVVSRILNQMTVYPDPWRKEPDGSDMKFCLITEDIPRRDFPDRYPKSKLARKIERELAEETDGEILSGGGDGDADDATGSLTSTGDNLPGWVTEKTIRVAEHFYVEYTRRQRLFVPYVDPVTGQQTHNAHWEDELPEDVQLPDGVLSREVVSPVVRWEVINATEILDEEQWPGRFIPILELLGEEHNVDGERTFKGIYTVGKDANRSYEYHRSALVEAVALAPKAPYIAAEGQTEDYPEWESANSENYAVLTYKPTSLEGHLVPPPQRNTSEPAIQAISIAAQTADQDIKDITGRHEASLGQYSSERSGKAVQSLQQQAQIGSSHFVTNLAEITMAHEARIIIDLLPHIYDRPGRVMRLLGEKDREEYAIIGQPFVQTPDGPQATPDMNPVPSQVPGQAPKKPKVYKFDPDADYTVAVGVGPSTQAARDQNAEMLKSVMEAVPALAPLLADVWALQLDSEISEQVAARLKAAQPTIAGLPDIDGEEDADLPPAAAAKIQGMTQQMQQMQQQMQAMQQELQTRSQQMQAQMAIAQQANATRERTVMATTRTQLAIANMKGGNDVDVQKLDADLKLMMQDSEQAHEKLMLGLKASLDAAMADSEHERGLEAGDRDEDRSRGADMRKDVLEERSLARQEQAERRADARKSLEGERSDGRKRLMSAEGDQRKAGMAESADQRKARLAEEADRRAMEAEERADARAGTLARQSDARKSNLAEEADERAGESAAAADKRKAAMPAKAPKAAKAPKS